MPRLERELPDHDEQFTPGEIDGREELSRSLGTLRQRNGFTLRELEKIALGKGLPLSRATASRIESGSFPSRQQLRAYMIACSVSPRDVGEWEAAWMRLAPLYSHGRRSRRDGTQKTSKPPTSQETRDPAHRSKSQKLGLLRALFDSTSRLESFLLTGDFGAAPMSPRLNVRLKLTPLGLTYFALTALLDITYDEPIEDPRFRIYATAARNTPHPGLESAGSLLLEIWHVEHVDLFSEFLETLRGSMQFRVASSRAGVGLTPVSRDSFCELGPADWHDLPEDFAKAEQGGLSRLIEADLTRLENGETLEGIDRVELQARSIYRNDALNFISWRPTGSAYLERVVIDSTDFVNPQSQNRFLAINSTPGQLPKNSQYFNAEVVVMPINSWVMSGHGISVIWASVAEQT